MCDHDKLMLGRFALVCALTIAFGLTGPAGVRVPFIAGLFVLAAIAAVATAMVRREPFRLDALTHWDHALAYFGTSRLFRLLTDPQSYETLRQLPQTGGAH